jgi:hypothetical protein
LKIERTVPKKFYFCVCVGNANPGALLGKVAFEVVVTKQKDADLTSGRRRGEM